MSNAVLNQPLNKTPENAIQVVKFHASLNVSDLNRSLAFYSTLLGDDAVKVYENYAKFEIDEPPLILSLKPQPSAKGGQLNHLGLRVLSVAALEAVEKRLLEKGYRPVRQENVRCCYAHQTKFWVADPDDTLWEVYVLHADHPTWGEGNKINLMMPSLRALGVFGSVRRLMSRWFGSRSNCTRPADVVQSPAN